jgi:trehalose-6-phosphate synthase
MSIDKNKVQTQEETGEPAPVDQVEERVEAEMELIEGRAKERVAQGLQDKKLEEEAHREEEDALKKLHEKTTD